MHDASVERYAHLNGTVNFATTLTEKQRKTARMTVPSIGPVTKPRIKPMSFMR
jgi:hypothetical protein